MTAATADKPNLMPPAEQLAVDAIKHLAAENYSSQVMKLRTPLLNEAARRLVEPGTNRADVLRWLNDENDAGLGERAWYFFCRRFEEAYKLVWGDIATKAMFTQIAADPAFDAAQLNEFIHNRVMQLVGQELMSAGPGELGDKRLFAMIDAVKVANKSNIDRERLALDRQLAEQRAEKLEADLRKRELDIQNLQQRLDQTAAKFEAEMKSLVARKAGKSQITDEDIADARRLIYGG